jgi:hypothetical protein
MNIEPTPKTAALAGAWLAAWVGAMDHWRHALDELSRWPAKLLMLSGAVLFMWLPVYFLVIGRQEPFDSGWWRHASERARRAAITRRLLIWFVSCGAVLALWTTGLALLK